MDLPCLVFDSGKILRCFLCLDDDSLSRNILDHGFSSDGLFLLSFHCLFRSVWIPEVDFSLWSAVIEQMPDGPVEIWIAGSLRAHCVGATAKQEIGPHLHLRIDFSEIGKALLENRDVFDVEFNAIGASSVEQVVALDQQRKRGIFAIRSPPDISRIRPCERVENSHHSQDEFIALLVCHEQASFVSRIMAMSFSISSVR